MIIRNNRKNQLIGIGDTFFSPGMNEVTDPAIIEQIKKNPVGQNYIKSGVLSIIDEKSSITTMETAEAVTVINDTWDKDLLERWKADEDRKEVKSAITAQVKKINKMEDERTKKEKDEDSDKK